MTQKLYHKDPYLQEFSSEVIEAMKINGKPAVVLKQTAFYPTSGVQPHDIGTLNDITVVDVIEDENHQIVHLLEEPLKGRRVRGLIDWQRRLDHMQQHTGQHVLSQVFSKISTAETISFHLGEESSTIDLNQSGFGNDAITRVVEGARGAVDFGAYSYGTNNHGGHLLYDVQSLEDDDDRDDFLAAIPGVNSRGVNTGYDSISSGSVRPLWNHTRLS